MSSKPGKSARQSDGSSVLPWEKTLQTARPDENLLKHWVLLSGNRLVVTATLLLLVFLFLLGLSIARPVDMRQLISETAAARTLFSSLLGGAILLVSIVVSINSTALSQEITDIESQQDRITAAIEYQASIEQIIDHDVSPTQPTDFLNAIFGAIARQTDAIADTAETNSNEEYTTLVDTIVEEVSTDLKRAQSVLQNSAADSFSVLLAGLNYDQAGQLNAARRLKHKHNASLDDHEEELIDDLIETLEFFAIGREYFKSLYYERELARLSSRLLYVSLPVIVFTSYVILAVDGTIVPETSYFGITAIVVFVSFAYTVALAPYVILTAYVIRLSAITLLSLASGPFIFQPLTGDTRFDLESTDAGIEWEVPRKEQ